MASIHRTIYRASERRSLKCKQLSVVNSKWKEIKNKMVKKFKLFLLKTLFKNDEILMNVKIDGTNGVEFTEKRFLYCVGCHLSNFQYGLPRVSKDYKLEA